MARFFFGFLQVSFFFVLYLVVGLTGAAGGVGWYYLDANSGYDPERVEALTTGAVVVDTGGQLIGRIGATDRKLIAREDIPGVFLDALLAAEDQRFFFHPGFDSVGTLRAAIANYRADSIQEGGSTLTQQLARDVYNLKGRDVERKLNEIALAFWIERRYSKDEILVHYLNRIYFGSGFYGLGAAAKGYFEKPVRELTVGESAMICGLIRSPSRFSPFVNRERAIASRDQTLRRMHILGSLTEAEMNLWIAETTPVADKRDQQIHRGQASFLLARIERETRNVLGDRSLEGLTIRSSVDLALQQAAAFEIDQHLKQLQEKQFAGDGGDDLEGAAIVVENASGRMVITVGSRDFSGSEYDRSRDMKRPPGSAFLPFVYAAAFESGRYDPDSIVIDAPFDNREMGLGGTSGVLGEWSTENLENRWEGPITAARALAQSKNSPTARIGLDLGLGSVSDLVAAAGMETPLRSLSGSLLGASELSLRELVRAYTIFPNRGVPAPPLGLVKSILAGEEVVYSAEMTPEAGRAVSAETAATIARLIGNAQSGTTPAFTDGWHFGFNETFTWGVWVGKDTFETLYPMAFGGIVAAPIADAITKLAAMEAVPGDGTEAALLSGNDADTGTSASAKKREATVKPSVLPLTGPDPYGTLGMK